jgi:2,5-diamino-6-(ribosylamino)-4(3H)-pyrimidinone 5'-phosphate reductase
MANRNRYPDTTLLLSYSVDGRITSHDSDLLDPDRTWKQTPGIRSILQQFYVFNQPNMVAFTTGQLMSNVGVNTRQGQPQLENLSLVVLDPDADLAPQGISYLLQNVKNLYLVCLNSHPIHQQTLPPSLSLLSYAKEIDLNHAFAKLKRQHHIQKLLIPSIAPLNAALIDAGLIHHLSIIISPILVGDHGIPVLPQSSNLNLQSLKLINVKAFNQHYISLQYDLV